MSNSAPISRHYPEAYPLQWRRYCDTLPVGSTWDSHPGASTVGHRAVRLDDGRWRITHKRSNRSRTVDAIEIARKHMCVDQCPSAAFSEADASDAVVSVNTFTVRDVQDAAMALGPRVTDRIVGRGGLSGASRAQLTKLVAEHRRGGR